jgi:hypothetical protein
VIACGKCGRPFYRNPGAPPECSWCGWRADRNTAGCCDGMGQVHFRDGSLAFITLCQDRECCERRERDWARECSGVQS